MSRFKLEFKLKQHTPIIHFQGDQYGATLRATELKPKLDKYLIKYVFDNNFERYKQFLIGYDDKKVESDFKDKKALDYKVKIEQDCSDGKQYELKLYFGDMGTGEDKQLKKNIDIFNLEIFTFHPSLKNDIEEAFKGFLVNTNFGTRQSKGYGCFYLDDVSFDSTLVKGEHYSFSITTVDWEDNLDIFYRFLRQGINTPDGTYSKNGCPNTSFYCKPAIFSYAENKGWTWEKKVIKQNFFSEVLSEQQVCRPHSQPLNYESEDEYLVRDLFGLSSSEKWESYNDASVKKTNSHIKRFKSPIVFKPIRVEDGYTIHFWVNDTATDIMGKEFNISSGVDNFDIYTPPPRDETNPNGFDFSDFFIYAFNINLSTHVENQFHNHDNFNKLRDILRQLRSQL